jgi:hypothetical protein
LAVVTSGIRSRPGSRRRPRGEQHAIGVGVFLNGRTKGNTW